MYQFLQSSPFSSFLSLNQNFLAWTTLKRKIPHILQGSLWSLFTLHEKYKPQPRWKLSGGSVCFVHFSSSSDHDKCGECPSSNRASTLLYLQPPWLGLLFNPSTKPHIKYNSRFSVSIIIYSCLFLVFVPLFSSFRFPARC